MSFEIRCEACGKALAAEDDMIGQTFACPVCGTPVTVTPGTRLQTESAQVRCPHCDRFVPPPGEICPNCGYDLLHRGMPTPPPPSRVARMQAWYRGQSQWQRLSLAFTGTGLAGLLLMGLLGVLFAALLPDRKSGVWAAWRFLLIAGAGVYSLAALIHWIAFWFDHVPIWLFVICLVVPPAAPLVALYYLVTEWDDISRAVGWLALSLAMLLLLQLGL